VPSTSRSPLPDRLQLKTLRDASHTFRALSVCESWHDPSRVTLAIVPPSPELDPVEVRWGLFAWRKPVGLTHWIRNSRAVVCRAVLASAWLATVVRKKPPGHYSVRLDTQLLVSQFRRCGDKRRGAQRFRTA
jgi:hypothetical protein